MATKKMTPAEKLARKKEIYTKAFINYTELGILLDKSDNTARRIVDDLNRAAPGTVRRFPRLGMATEECIKAFGLQHNRRQILGQ